MPDSRTHLLQVFLRVYGAPSLVLFGGLLAGVSHQVSHRHSVGVVAGGRNHDAAAIAGRDEI
jgi:hypothetical protein